MAKTISQLAIKLGLTSAGVGTGVKQAGVQLEGFQRKAQRFNRSATPGVFGRMSGGAAGLTKALGPMAAGLAAAAGAAMSFRAAMNQVGEAMGRVDEQAKFADRIGIGLTQLRALEFQAQASGASVGTLRTSLQRMTRRVAEASEGTGTAVKALQALGLSTDDLMMMRPDEQFHAIATALQGVGKRSDQVRHAMALFDTEGVSLLNTLDSIAFDGMSEVMDKAEEMGLAMSRVDAEAVEEANDAILELKTAFAAAWDEVAVNFAPMLKDLIPIFKDVAWWIGEVASGIGELYQFTKEFFMGRENIDAWAEYQRQMAKRGQDDVEVVAEAQRQMQREAAEATKALEANAKKRRDIEKEIAAFDRSQQMALSRSAAGGGPAPTVGAIGAGAGALSFLAQVQSREHSAAAQAEAHRRLVEELDAQRNLFMEEMNRRLAQLVAKEPVVVNQTTLAGV